MSTRPLRRVGIVGGSRIPFCRQNTAYVDLGNFGMSVKAVGAVVERFGLAGVELGEVALGAVIIMVICRLGKIMKPPYI